MITATSSQHYIVFRAAEIIIEELELTAEALWCNHDGRVGVDSDVEDMILQAVKRLDQQMIISVLWEADPVDDLSIVSWISSDESPRLAVQRMAFWVIINVIMENLPMPGL